MQKILSVMIDLGPRCRLSGVAHSEYCGSLSLSHIFITRYVYCIFESCDLFSSLQLWWR